MLRTLDQDERALLHNGFAHALLGTIIVAATMLMGNTLATTIAVTIVMGYLLTGVKRLSSTWWALGAVLPPLLAVGLVVGAAVVVIAGPLLRYLW